MWKWYSADESPPVPAGAASSQKNIGNQSVADLTEQLAQNEQLVLQLKELIREKDNQLQVKDQLLKEDKEAFEAKISKMKLQTKAKVTSLSAQLEDVKKQLGASSVKEQTTGKHKQSSDGDQEHAAANRGKILMLRKKVEELETQIVKKDTELKKTLTELEAQLQRGTNMDMMLAEKDKKLAEKEAYIIELQLAAVSNHAPQQVTLPSEEIEAVQHQLGGKETSSSDLQSMVHILTKKVEENEESFSLLQEQVDNLKDQLNKEKIQYQEKEAMYMKNIRVFQEIIQAKENKLAEQAQKHEQELFIVASKLDASADFEQLLKALKQKLHEKEEVLMGRTQVVDVLQKELDGRDQKIQEIIEKLKLVQLEKDHLEAKLDAEKHVMRAQVRDLMERHEMDLKTMREKHSMQLRAIEEKHEDELAEKEQHQLKLLKQLQDLQAHGNASVILETTATIDKQKIGELEEQLKLKMEEVAKSEAKFLKMKAWSKSRIRQAEEDVRNAITGTSHQEQIILKNRVAELEEEKGNLEQKVNDLEKLRLQNEELLAKLELYEEQQQKMQADLEQMTKQAISQTSESGSAEELQSRLLEWQEMVSESARGQAKEERAVMELRMTQIEEEREELIEDDWFFPGCSDPALVSGQQELEEELVQLRRLEQHQGREKCARDSQNLKVDYEYEKQYFEESSVSVDNADNTEGENLGGLRTVVEELELERNRLQEQILMLEERYQDLEDKAQLRARIEFHQSESERLQNQLSLVRSQQSRDFEQHQHLISNLNEQLKGVNDKKDFLENSLLGKESLLAESSAKLLQMDKLKESLEAQKIINQDLTGKLLQAEENLGNVNKKCSSFEIECADLKNVVQDLSEKLSSNKEKVQKQEVAMEVLHQDLEQANDELERLNSSHLEERARLIDDLQSCEREIDLLKETIAEKAHELTDLFKTVAEYSEHNITLKEQNKCKEQEIGELRAALEKVEMEIMLLRKTQSVDDQTTNASISALVDQLSQIESELSNARSEDETKGKEIASLLKQIGENNNIIQGLHSELQKQKQSAKAHLVDCSAQISLLENKIIIATQQLQETTAANQQEIESLKAQLIESSLAKGRLDRSLREKEEKEQCLENEMKTLKNQCNNLISDAVGKKEELTKLSKKFAEHKKEAEIRLQEKMDLVASLEKKLQAIQETNSQLIQEVQAKEIERQDLKNQIDEMTGLLADLKKQTQELNETNGQLQATVKEQVQSLSEQAKLLSESNERIANHLEVEFNLEHQIKELTIKNENFKEIVNMKEDELFNRNDVIQQLEKGIASKEEQILQYISTISQLQIDKESIVPKLELLKMLEQKEGTVEEQLREKIDECDFLKNQILENQKTTEQVRGQLQSLTVQLGELRLLLAERENSLSNKITECISLQNQLHEGQETLMRLQDQIQDSNIELEVKDVALKQKLSECDGLQKTLSQQQLTAKSLESQVHALTEETEKLRQLLENRESLLSNKSSECHVLQGQLDLKTDTIVSLQKQMEALTVDKQCLQSESKELQLSLSKWTAEHNQLLIKANNCESVAAFAQDQAKILVIENQKLKENLENVNSTLCSKTDEVAALQALLSQKVGMVTSLNENVSTMDVGNGKFALNLEGKQISSNRQAMLLQQEQGKVLQEDRQMSQYVQIISHLQAQVQMITSEAAQFKQMLQEKETALQQKADLGGELEKITAEHEALKLQSMENMETILKLQNQIQAMTSKIYELKCSLEERDKLLACKVDECVKVKAVLSETEDIISQLQEQLAAASTEVEQLRTTVQEKEMMVQQIKENTATCNEALMLKIQTKETEYSALNEKFNNLEHLLSQCNNQINQQNSEISQLKEVLVQKEASVLEERNLVRKWQDRANECDFLKLEFTESREKVSQLQNEVQNLLSESKRLEELLHEKETAFSHLQERYAAQSEQFEEFGEMLRVKEQEITELQAALCTKDVNIQVIESNVNALMIEVKSLKEELQKSQVSLTDYRNVIQQKDDLFAINQRNIESQIVTLEAQKIQYKEAAERLDMINQDLKQNELILQKKYLDQTHHIEKLDSKLKASIEKSAEDYQEKAALIEHLYQQSDQLKKENSQLVHQIKVMKMEKEQTSVSYQQKANELQVLEEKLATMCDIRGKLDISQLLKDETGSLQNQLKVTVCLKDQNLCNSNSEIKWLRNKIEELEKLLQAKLQEQTEQDISSFQNEMAELRSEKTLLLSESTATKEQYLLKVADHDRQFTELSTLNQEVWTSDLANINTVQQMKPLEVESSLSNENIAEQMKSLLIEKKQLQSEVQGYLQEIHHKEQKFQKLNNEVMQSIEEKTTLSSQLKAVSQTLRDTQSRYGDLQDRYYRLERQYQTIRSSLHNEEQNETNEEVPPGAPQERASVIVEIDNLELSELRRRLAESDQRNDSAHQELSQLAEVLAQEELRRSAAEEALIAAEEILKGLDIPTVRQPPREYTIQLESDEEREALIIDPSEHVVVRKVKRGALSFKRWLRGRSLYCSKIMSSRARSRYLVFVYFVTLHILVFMCLTGLL